MPGLDLGFVAVALCSCLLVPFSRFLKLTKMQAMEMAFILLSVFARHVLNSSETDI